MAETIRDAEAEWFRDTPNAVPLPGLKLGATDSAHNVFFGRKGHRTVAIKPYSGRNPESSAKHERQMLEIIRCAGFATLTPIEVQVGKDGVFSYLLTQHESGLTTVSTIVQDRGVNVDATLQETARTLARAHSAGISHGDAQAKNFAIKIGQEGVMIIDPEKGGTDDIGHIKTAPMQHDIDSMVQSLAHLGYGGRNVDIAGDRVMANVLDPYYTEASRVMSTAQAESLTMQALDTFMEKRDQLNGAA